MTKHASTNPALGGDIEIWDCQGGPQQILVDSDGCPLDSSYCKIQAGNTALAVAAGAAFTIPIVVTNLVFARVRGFIMQASDPAAVAADLDMLPTIGVTGIDVLGNQMISGEVPGTRFRNDTQGPGGIGIQQLYRGDLGTAGGAVTVVGINRSAVAVDVWAAIDITGKKAA